MTDPPFKKEGRLCGAALRELELQRAYRILHLVQAPFAAVFWMLEQAKAQIDVELERRAS